MLCYRIAFELDDPEARKQYKSIPGLCTYTFKTGLLLKANLARRFRFLLLPIVHRKFQKFLCVRSQRHLKSLMLNGTPLLAISLIQKG